MRRAMIPMLLLTAAALATGVVLPLLQPFEVKPDPNSLEDQNNHITRNALECELLKRFFCKTDWMNENNKMKTWKMLGDPTYNNPKGIDHNEYSNLNGVSDDYESQKEPWIGIPRPFDRLQKTLQNNYYDFLKDNFKEKSGKFGYFKKYPPLQNVERQTLGNQDIPIANNKAVYATHVDPLDFFENRLNRQYRNIAYQHLYYENPSTDVDIGKPRKMWDNSPLMEDVIVKRDGDSGPGQKEIPDTLVFQDEQKSAEQKKLFSFWSRLQSMSQKGRKLPTRRYSFVYYGPDGVRDGPLTAEIRASHLRPPGQPLRWG